MKKLLLSLLLLPSIASANGFDYSANIKSLYGYSTNNDSSNLPTETELELSYNYKKTSFYLDIIKAFDKTNETYNRGNWGYSLYSITQSDIGDIQIGQTSNVANQFYVGAFEYSYFDITDFIKNPSWQKSNKTTQYSTFNSASINTDGLTPKISYITPKIYNTYIGFSYVPDAHDNTALATSQAKQGYVASFLNHQDFGKIDIATSMSYAYYKDIDEEYSASIKASYGNYYIAGGYKKSNANGSDKIELYNGYRSANAYDIGAGYNFGPYEIKISYLNSSSNKLNIQDQYVALSQKYQLNKNFDIYLIGAYADFDNKEKGYSFITGLKINI